jgi:hypothetical protein
LTARALAPDQFTVPPSSPGVDGVYVTPPSHDRFISRAQCAGRAFVSDTAGRDLDAGAQTLTSQELTYVERPFGMRFDGCKRCQQTCTTNFVKNGFIIKVWEIAGVVGTATVL